MKISLFESLNFRTKFFLFSLDNRLKLVPGNFGNSTVNFLYSSIAFSDVKVLFASIAKGSFSADRLGLPIYNSVVVPKPTIWLILLFLLIKSIVILLSIV